MCPRSNMFGKIKCLIRLHKWGDWIYASATSCEQIRTCERCEKQKRRSVKHTWEKWYYIKPDRCEQVQFCRRCNAKGSDIIISHEWEKWDYIKPDRCEQVQFCRRCDAEGSDINVSHKWTKWTAWNNDPDGNNSYDSICQQRVRNCTRCEKKEIERVGHSWREKIGFDYLVCTRCKRFGMNSPPSSSRRFEAYKSYDDR